MRRRLKATLRIEGEAIRTRSCGRRRSCGRKRIESDLVVESGLCRLKRSKATSNRPGNRPARSQTVESDLKSTWMVEGDLVVESDSGTLQCRPTQKRPPTPSPHSYSQIRHGRTIFWSSGETLFCGPGQGRGVQGDYPTVGFSKAILYSTPKRAVDCGLLRLGFGPGRAPEDVLHCRSVELAAVSCAGALRIQLLRDSSTADAVRM